MVIIIFDFTYIFTKIHCRMCDNLISRGYVNVLRTHNHSFQSILFVSFFFLLKNLSNAEERKGSMQINGMNFVLSLTNIILLVAYFCSSHLVFFLLRALMDNIGRTFSIFLIKVIKYIVNYWNCFFNKKKFFLCTS